MSLLDEIKAALVKGMSMGMFFGFDSGLELRKQLKAEKERKAKKNLSDAPQHTS